MARVLLVEDNPLLRWVLRTTLVMDGYDVSAPPSSREAVELGRRTPFDIVITDLTILPGPDGFAVVEEIRQIYPRTHFILISAQADDAMADRARHAGVERVIEKPFPIDLIHAAVRELIPQERTVVS
jgi:CheY-like chemotaxis protein